MNVNFFRGFGKSLPEYLTIKEMQAWKGNYNELETNHHYVQWLFPNRFHSQANKDSVPLSKEEATTFQQDIEIANQVVKNYELMLDFFGMKLVNKSTGQLARAENYMSRYYETLISRGHNRLRMRRILHHLNNVGFRPYAISLVEFLDREIYGAKRFDDYIEMPFLDRQIYIAEARDAPMKNLAMKKGCYDVWKIYGNHKNMLHLQRELEHNCFMTLEEMNTSIYFK